MKIYHLEDDSLYADSIQDELDDIAKREDLNLDFERLLTESRLMKRLDEIVEKSDGVLLDVMVRWTFPGEEDKYPISAEAKEQGYYYAGIRCSRALLKRAQELDQTVRIALYTVYTKEELEAELNDLRVDVGPNLQVFTKSEDLTQVASFLFSDS